MKKKLLFIQLPIPRLKKISCEDHNLPVAAYYLQSYVQEQAIAWDVEIQILDPYIQNYGSEETILHEILKFAPDVIGFSLFCWNIERSLYLAGQIKQARNRNHPPFILAGGPEVTKDNALLHHSAIDLYVYGEGEYTLTSILESWLADQRIPLHLPGTMYTQQVDATSNVTSILIVNPPQQRAIDLNTTKSAYLKGLVLREHSDQMFFETMRGCPFACRFCYYNKHYGVIRFLNQEHVLELLKYAIERQYREIFLLDPSFNIRPDLEELLKKMAELNKHKRVKIATELRADMVDEHSAQLLADAGIYEVEIGLQSIHPDTIRLTGRTQNLDTFLRGARAMLARGIETKVDLIVGLPGDTLEKFKESARWVKREGLDGYLQVFCLSVLPGTYFREYANELGLKFSPFPPYYLLSSRDWSAADIREAFSWAEDYFGITFEPDIDEEFSVAPVPGNSFREIIYVDPSQPFEYPSLTTSITKWIIGPLQNAEDLFTHLTTIQMYTHKNPYGIYHVYLDLQHEIPVDALSDFCTAFKSLRRQFIDRDFSVLSVNEAPIFHYQMAILIKKSLLPTFSEQYLEIVRQHFHLETLDTP
jgi:radical SAM superfamily enzyme YgiQ (UPF0313 family)